MTQLRITASKRIQSPAELVYSIIADYNEGHPSILPKPYFELMTVEKGGIGAGTIIRFKMRVMGRLQEFRAQVSEPKPGFVLVEKDLDNGSETTFTVEPRLEDESALVTITTDVEIRGGVAGKIESWLTRRLLSPIYEKELDQLARIAEERVGKS